MADHDERLLLCTRGGSVGAALLHLAAGLGYGWAVDALLGAGARPDLRVRSGRVMFRVSWRAGWAVAGRWMRC